MIKSADINAYLRSKHAFTPMPPDQAPPPGAMPPQGGPPPPQGAAPAGGPPQPQAGAPAPQGGAPSPQDMVQQIVQEIMADPATAQQILANPQAAAQALQQQGIPPEIVQQVLQVLQQQGGQAQGGQPPAGAPPSPPTPSAEPTPAGTNPADVEALGAAMQQLAGEVADLKRQLGAKGEAGIHPDAEKRIRDVENMVHRMEAKTDAVLKALNTAGNTH